MIQVTPQMRILVALDPADFRRGIDGLARMCREELAQDPFSGAAFVFRNRRRTSIRVLIYDGQGYWLATKRLSAGRFRFWPAGTGSGKATALEAHQLQLLLSGGDPDAGKAAPVWRRVSPGS